MATNTEPKWYRDMTKSIANNEYTWEQDMDTVTSPGKTYTFHGQGGETNTTTFKCGEEVMLKFSDKGFWVRGEKVEQDDKEAEVVYNAFRAWLTWAQLNGQF